MRNYPFQRIESDHGILLCPGQHGDEPPQHGGGQQVSCWLVSCLNTELWLVSWPQYWPLIGRQAHHGRGASHRVCPPLHLKLYLHLWNHQGQVRISILYSRQKGRQKTNDSNLKRQRNALLKPIFPLQIHAEPAGAAGVCLPAVSHQEQDHQRGGALHRGPGILHRVQQVTRHKWLIVSAANQSIGSTTGCTITEKAPGWKRLLALSHLRHY